ncbi:MAG: helix-turn-helix domain-containing protein [Rhodospirillales bacterium]
MAAASRGIQSVDIALAVLTALAAAPGPATLGDLAQATGMAPAKLHRYLASFVNAGFVVQRRRSGAYDLGPAALWLGVGAMARSDIVNRVAGDLPLLTAETGATALLAVWGSQGATIVRWERSPGFIVTTLGLGVTLPLLGSATGRLFLAYSSPGVIADRLRAEGGRPDDAELSRQIDSVRQARIARTEGRFIPGLSAASAPVLNWQGEIEAAVTLVSTDSALVADGSMAMAVLDGFCRRHSLDVQIPAT